MVVTINKQYLYSCSSIYLPFTYHAIELQDFNTQDGTYTEVHCSKAQMLPGLVAMAAASIS